MLDFPPCSSLRADFHLTTDRRMAGHRAMKQFYTLMDIFIAQKHFDGFTNWMEVKVNADETTDFRLFDNPYEQAYAPQRDSTIREGDPMWNPYLRVLLLSASAEHRLEDYGITTATTQGMDNVHRLLTANDFPVGMSDPEVVWNILFKWLDHSFKRPARSTDERHSLGIFCRYSDDTLLFSNRLYRKPDKNAVYGGVYGRDYEGEQVEENFIVTPGWSSTIGGVPPGVRSGEELRRIREDYHAYSQSPIYTIPDGVPRGIKNFGDIVGKDVTPFNP